MTTPIRSIALTAFFIIGTCRLSGQPADTTISQALTGAQIVEATHSIRFSAGFSYDAGTSGQMVARIIPTAANAGYIFTEPQESGSLNVNTSYPVGTIPGSASVSPTGAATYSIPIDLPPGRNGIEPQLSLVYNSQGGEGLLGLGWALAGFSSVTRVPSDIYHEGYIDPVDFDTTDRFALDGERLICIGGDQYRTESESYSKITLYGTVTNPTYFKVETRDGMELYYGNTSDSRVEAQNISSVYAWNLNQVKDKNGNYYTISYTETNSTGEIYPASMMYTYSSGLTARYSVEFGYQTRSVPVKSYIAGSQVMINKLLNLITVKYGSTVVGKYQLNYTSQKLTEVVRYGKNNTRLNSTLVNWGTANTGLNETNSYGDISNPTLSARYFGDFNGDGKKDFIIIYPGQNAYLLYEANDNQNFTCHPPMYASIDTLTAVVGDVNGDGDDDLLVFALDTIGFRPGILLSGTRFYSIDYCIPKKYDPKFLLGDFDGDNNDELLVKYHNTNSTIPNCKIFKINTSTNPATLTEIVSTRVEQWGDSDDPFFCRSNDFILDINGDGKTDILALVNGTSHFYEVTNGTLNQIYSFTSLSALSTILLGDYNGDGKTDIVSANNSGWTLYTATGNGFITSTFTVFDDFYMNDTINKYYSCDVDNDGKSDLIAIGRGNRSSGNVNIYVAYSTGQGFNKQTYYPSSALHIRDSTAFYEDYNHVGDFNGDGNADVYYGDGSIGRMYTIYRGKNQNLVSNIQNGFGKKVEFVYKPMTDNTVYTKGNTNSPKVMDIRGPLYVVSSVKADNIQSTQVTTNYTYNAARMHKQGKGFLGFGKVTAVNTTLNTKTISEYAYDTTFFNVFLKKQSGYVLPDSSSTGVLVSEATFTNAVTSLGNKRIFPYVDNSTETSYLTGATVTKDYTYDSNGNLTTYREGFDDGSYNIINNSNFSSAGTWITCRPQTVTVTKKHYQDSQTYSLTTNYSYYSATGSIYTQTVGPLTTTYTYDSYGNPAYVTVSGGSTSRTNHFEYDSTRMFVWKAYNALNHVTVRTYDYATGNVLTETAPNTNLVTTNTYDDFGTLTNTTVSGLGQSQTIAYGWTTGTRPLGAVYYRQVTTAGAPTTKEYYDAFGRMLRTETTGFDGNTIYSGTVYNTKGQVTESSLPYKQGETALKKVFSYDMYGRPILESSDAGAVSYRYSGKTTQVTPESGQTTSKTVDSQGNVITATDNGGSVSYTYKSIGKPGSVTTNSSTTSMVYDSYGRQTSLSEPNAGTTSYRYNSFGELTSQTDAKGKVDSLTYDLLGRVTTEVRSEGTKTYTYDPTGNPGLMSSVSYPGGNVSYSYDSYGRLQSKTTNIDGTNYTTGYSYDSYSRLQTLTYPSGFAIKNVYNTFGYLDEVRRNDNNTLIWDGISTNAFGQFTQYQYGNNLTTTKTYDALGMLRGITTGSVQNLGYSFDAATGNLLSRRDNLRGLTEVFGYDNLNRLTSVSGPAPVTMTYASNGNIQSKTSVGSYTYGTKPHAVTSVTNPDDLIPSTEQRISYTSFNKADSIIQGNYVYTLSYGAGDQRTISRFYDNGVLQKTVYYAGAYEKEVTGTQVRQLHYIAGGDGLAAIFVRNNGNDTMYYVHTDHLGSFDVITNQSGQVVQRYSFDAWGRRRNPDDWTYTSVPTSYMFSRGYSGQEHLDQFGLINFNGRIYDPVLGRFLGPDPYVQDPFYSQDFNRYSYCLNNPLRYTDPTGYTWLSHFTHWVGGTAKKALNVVVNVVVDIAAITIGVQLAIVTTAVSTVVGIGQGIFTGNWTILKNDVKIVGGLFTGSPGQILSRLTWELPQTIVGYVASQGSNMIGDVKSVSYYDGATVVQHYSKDWGGFTLGSYINGDNSIEADPTNQLFQHEYGHYLQSQEAGWAYLFEYAIPSAYNGLTCPKGNDHGYYEHLAYGVEQDANIRARAYFGEKVWNYYYNPIFDSGHNPDFDRDYSKYRTNQGLIHTPWWESALTMALCIGI